jgi:hypothetical protein
MEKFIFMNSFENIFAACAGISVCEFSIQPVEIVFFFVANKTAEVAV